MTNLKEYFIGFALKHMVHVTLASRYICSCNNNAARMLSKQHPAGKESKKKLQVLHAQNVFW
jgi:hypothetical protein